MAKERLKNIQNACIIVLLVIKSGNKASSLPEKTSVNFKSHNNQSRVRPISGVLLYITTSATCSVYELPVVSLDHTPLNICIHTLEDDADMAYLGFF